MSQDLAAQQRRRRARRDWPCGVSSSHEDLRHQDVVYWRAQPGHVRLQACFEVTRLAWSIRDDGDMRGVDFNYHGIRSR